MEKSQIKRKQAAVDNFCSFCMGLGILVVVIILVSVPLYILHAVGWM